MKLVYDLSDDYLKVLNEAQGIALSKNKILRNKSSKCLSYLNKVLVVFIPVMVLSLLMMNNYKGMIILFLLDILCLLLFLVRMYSSYSFREKKDFKNTLVINKSGIKDISSFDNIEILFKWSRIKAVVIKNYSVVILTDSPIFFFFNIKDKKRILSILKEYNKDILIIK